MLKKFFLETSLDLYPRSLKPKPQDWQAVEKVIALEDKVKKLSQEELQEESKKLRTQIQEEENISKHTVYSFALIREAAFRTLGKKHYPTQILAGLLLARGIIGQVATGEGKTLIGTLPVYLWGLTGQGVHVVTSNQYLAERDFELMGPVYSYLGLSVGVLKEQESPEEKRVAYEKDITFGVGHEFGFDYLRDQLQILNQPKKRLGENFLSTLAGKKNVQVQSSQRGHYFALLDEIDSVLVDEARSPLVISGGQAKRSPTPEVYQYACQVAEEMEMDKDFEIHTARRQLHIEEIGYEKIQESISHVRLPPLKYPWSHYVEQALRAKYLFQRDSDYLIEEEKIVIIDEYTGRKYAERSWSEGLHQAVEAKENLPITEENKALARVTRQKYFSFYTTLAGMTGTAQSCEREFWEFYRCAIAQVPLNKTSRRMVLPDRVFDTLENKWLAVVNKIREVNGTGQPILVGTRTIQESEIISRFLAAQGIKHQVLNAKQDNQEAKIVSQAGKVRAVTIATNMAGRGTDIPLEPGMALEKGLFVLGTERHESRRVDLQLIGRCARQGDPGIAQFYLSLEDHLIQVHAPKLVAKQLDSSLAQGELPPKISQVFDKLQEKLEKQHFQTRKSLLQYDTWVDEVLRSLYS